MLTTKQIKKLPVITVSGKKLGRVNEVFVDPESQSIMQYQVTPHRLLSLDLPLLIHRSQVVSVTSERLLVEDNVVKAKNAVHVISPLLPSVVSSVAATTTLANE
ncbi:MAG: hypothetical protein UX10_C0037G0004 [Candidatus Magasanikbacteria bacterium GW2011_GWA2_45_39]|uniref:PRC-barrel domain-containing protein n=2 Tax=Candidatus Magasanikiibacteriota TaxID=1752731 RepID=A0A0G1MXX4_9BACT|nr:MAG: hypothetical protein UX10_C0037G0004 [Candidatus Magasanikbacteria bacterium GW2011_GWA2_45_39]KKU13216.1 MAG: hypothetical protein UX20_C0028G0005 [Candidatus Magasanikbacteria bacterium GW2011_GWC2_45_8]HBW74428.1 hypothetical protein [Candidatus Magasanikbacteria bacterium]